MHARSAQRKACLEWHEPSGPFRFHRRCLSLEAFVARQQRDRVWSMCDEGVHVFGVGPFSNHRHSSLDTSKGHEGRVGNRNDESRMAFHVSLEHDVHTKGTTRSVPMRLWLPRESAILLKPSLSPRMIYTPIVWFVFLANISDLLGLSRGGIGVLWLHRLEWMSNFKGC